MRIHTLALPLAAAMFIAVSLSAFADDGDAPPPGDARFHAIGPLPRPLVLHAQARSPGKLIDAAERLCGGLFAGIKGSRDGDPVFPSGAIRAVASRALPEAFLADDAAGIELVLSMPNSRDFADDGAVILTGLDGPRLEALLNDLGLEAERGEDGEIAGASGSFMGENIHFVRLDDGRVVVHNKDFPARRVAKAIAGWLPPPLERGDVRLRIDFQRLLANVEPEMTALLRVMDDRDFPRNSFLAVYVPGDDVELSRRLKAARLQAMIEQYFGLLGQIATIDAVLSLEGDDLRADCRLGLVDGFNPVSFLAQCYAEAGNAEFTIEGMAEDDALLFTAFTDSPGRLGWAGAPTALLGDLFAIFMPEAYREYEGLKGGLYLNSKHEEATALYLRDNRLMYSLVAKPNSAGQMRNAWIDSGKMFETFGLSLFAALPPSRYADFSLIDIESGKIGDIDFNILRPVRSGFAEIFWTRSVEDVKKALGGHVLVGDDGTFFLALVGDGASPAEFPKLAERASGSARKRLVDREEYQSVFRRLKSRHFGYVMAKPVDLLGGAVIRLAATGEANFNALGGDLEEYFRDFPGKGLFAGASFGAEDHALTMEAIIPIEALNGMLSIAFSLFDGGDFNNERMEAAREARGRRQAKDYKQFSNRIRRAKRESYWPDSD